ncbi:hypothetical protein WA026_005011 [Henosepilachna vigintioctopunctata]|uniref:Uncharacterized protein n=1 Tax=Henosepilachna vigintioctopunctata TaxID=420089 RepID=A0AAW1UVR8_9CUCU
MESSFKVHVFTEEIHDKKIIFQVLKMLDSCMIFINDKEDLKFNDLTLALQSRFEQEPLCTRLIGHTAENTSINLSNKLKKKLNKTVYVSLNIDEDRLLVPAVEKRLNAEIKSNPDNF